MATKRKTPLLRFRGFSEEWEKHKLKDIINYIVDNRGKNPAYYCDFGIPVIDNFMIGDTYPDLEKANRYIDEELFNNFIRKYNQPDDILITLVGNGIGKVSLFPDKKAVIIQNTLGLRSESNDKKFCYYTLLSKQDDVVALDRGMAQPSIRQDELLDLEIYTTSDFEEKKISAFVFTIDNLISLQKKKYKKLVATKRALFEKMFPKNGDDAAPLRFKGYESAWQKKILGKIGTTYTGLSGKTKDDFGHGEARFVTYVNVFKNPIADIKCEKLSSITLPVSVKFINQDAFEYCESLLQITYTGTTVKWKAIRKNDYWRRYSKISKVICTDETITFDN